MFLNNVHVIRSVRPLIRCVYLNRRVALLSRLPQRRLYSASSSQAGQDVIAEFLDELRQIRGAESLSNRSQQYINACNFDDLKQVRLF